MAFYKLYFILMLLLLFDQKSLKILGGFFKFYNFFFKLRIFLVELSLVIVNLGMMPVSLGIELWVKFRFILAKVFFQLLDLSLRVHELRIQSINMGLGLRQLISDNFELTLRLLELFLEAFFFTAVLGL